MLPHSTGLQRSGLHRRRAEQNHDRRGQGNRRQPAANVRDELTAPEQLKIALGQKCRRHTRIVGCVSRRVSACRGAGGGGTSGRAPCRKGAIKRERVHCPVRSECAVSSVGEHHIDTVGVASSILAPRTIQKARGYGLFRWMRGPGKVANGGRNSSRKGVQMRWIRGPNEGTGFGPPSKAKMRANHRPMPARSPDLARQPADHHPLSIPSERCPPPNAHTGPRSLPSKAGKRCWVSWEPSAGLTRRHGLNRQFASSALPISVWDARGGRY
jgi:hypothetical protein